MKTSVGCLLLCVCLGISQCFMQAQAEKRKGFRMGAANRFSHGFGKRSELLADSETILSDGYLTTDELARLIATSPELTLLFVERYVDMDGNGIVTSDEIGAKR